MDYHKNFVEDPCTHTLTHEAKCTLAYILSHMRVYALCTHFVVIHYNHLKLSFKFHEDPSVNARARVENARIRDITCARAFTTRARAFMHGS